MIFNVAVFGALSTTLNNVRGPFMATSRFNGLDKRPAFVQAAFKSQPSRVKAIRRAKLDKDLGFTKEEAQNAFWQHHSDTKQFDSADQLVAIQKQKSKLDTVVEQINGSTEQKFLDAVKVDALVSVKEYIANGIDVNTAEEGNTALIIASKKGYEDIVDVLLEARAIIELENWNECNALVLATLQYHNGIVEKLLDNITDTEDKKYFGQVLIYLAELGKNDELKPILQDRGIIADTTGVAGRAAFTYFNNCKAE